LPIFGNFYSFGSTDFLFCKIKLFKYLKKSLD
jgi:hypothetical protein